MVKANKSSLYKFITFLNYILRMHSDKRSIKDNEEGESIILKFIIT